MASTGKGGHDYLDLGNWNAVCSMCGRKRKASELVRNWQGMYRCPEHNEPRHPQEYVRAVPDIQTPPWVQPPSDVFAAICFPNDVSAISDFAVADCAICDYVSPFFNPDLYTPEPTVTIQFIGIQPWESSTASATTQLPGGLLDGDLMILCAAPDTSGNAMATPAGWTEFSFSPLTGAFPYRTRMFWRVAGNEPHPLEYTFTRGAPFSWHGFIVAYRGCNVTAPINAEISTVALGSGTTWSCAGLVTTVPNTVVVTILSVQNGSQRVAFSKSLNSTQRGTLTYHDPAIADFEPLTIQDFPQLASGLVPTFSGGLAPSGLWCLASIALASL